MTPRKPSKPTKQDSSTRARFTAGRLTTKKSKTSATDKIATGDHVSVIDSIAGQIQASASRRDFNLIRAILLEAEQAGPHTFTFPEYERAMIENHLMLVIEAGLVQGTIMREGTGSTHVLVNRLTWAGHDFVALLRDNARWQDVRIAALDAHGRAHFDVLVRILQNPPKQ
jgi:hypothetical protein